MMPATTTANCSRVFLCLLTYYAFSTLHTASTHIFLTHSTHSHTHSRKHTHTHKLTLTCTLANAYIFFQYYMSIFKYI